MKLRYSSSSVNTNTKPRHPVKSFILPLLFLPGLCFGVVHITTKWCAPIEQYYNLETRATVRPDDPDCYYPTILCEFSSPDEGISGYRLWRNEVGNPNDIPIGVMTIFKLYHYTISILLFPLGDHHASTNLAYAESAVLPPTLITLLQENRQAIESLTVADNPLTLTHPPEPQCLVRIENELCQVQTKLREAAEIVETSRRRIRPPLVNKPDIDPESLEEPKKSRLRKVYEFTKEHYLAMTNYITPALFIDYLLKTFLYGEILRKGVTEYQTSPRWNFEGCETELLVSTAELITDLAFQNIITQVLPQPVTFNQMLNATHPYSNDATEFKTTGYFYRFRTTSEKCRCPYCPESGIYSHSQFSHCLTDITLQRVILGLEIMKQMNSNPDAFLPEQILIAGYFKQFDTIGNLTNPSCGCQACPKIETESSKQRTEAVINIVDIASTAAITAILYAAKKLFDHCRR